jgi:two-component system, NtrC family, response regulator AtoC
MANILIVDDDALLRRALADRLKHWGHATEEAPDGRTTLAAVGRREFDLILLDLSMPEMSGLEVLRQVRNAGCGADVVILTAHGSIESAVEAIKLGAADFLLKPADFDLLRAVLARSLERRRLQRVNRALADRVSGGASFVTGDSPAMQELLDTATRAAHSNATLLLLGESGSGKQVLAEYIHAQSPRAKGPFVYVNCAALSDDLIESTLFGHEKGAFTGAVARKEGRLEGAAGGTAFLDEIGDVSGRLQTKLLHFLETNEFERVGGTRTIAIDCRLIAATNRNLEVAVKEGRFREDLYFRLNVIRLRIPPLRERPADIPVLAQAFLDRTAAELGRGTLRLADGTAAAMQVYAWPGNVRQLKNAVERMVVLARGDVLTPDLLPPEMLAPAADPGVRSDLPLNEAVLEFRRAYIARTLSRFGGNQTKAAESLGLQRTFLNRLIKEYGL